MKNSIIIAGCVVATLCFQLASCSSDNGGGGDSPKPEKILPDDYYAGGRLGTTYNTTSSAYEQNTQAIDDAGLIEVFKRGERLFESNYDLDTASTTPMRGLGPMWTRYSCIQCHPNYGHGHRITTYNSNERGNGCLITVIDKDGNVATSLGEVPMTVATQPFKPMLDESKVTIDWKHYVDDWGNKFPDGETYDLIYPEVTLPESALYSPLEVNGKPLPMSEARVTLQSTIGLYGVGLLDAIPDDSLKAQYVKESAHATLNPRMWNGTDFASTGVDASGHPYRFDYFCDFAKLQANTSLWEVTNVITPMFPYLYINDVYARTSSKDPDVQSKFYDYYPEWNKTGNVETDIYNFLTSQNQRVEMPASSCYDLMVWFRGLAVPAARDVESTEFQRGKQLFNEIGCAACHRPSWTTGDDDVVDPYNLTNHGSKAMPRYPHQKIWPYSDLIQHRLYMQNDIRTGWCRTTPLWGRGLSRKVTGSDDRLHDCRARTVIEAIMWHGNSKSDARWAVENFRKLSKTDRDAVVKFIESI